MAWYDEDSWVTAAFAPKPATMALTLFLAIVLPILLHQFIYRKATPTNLPVFLLIGPSGAGKTALLTLVGPTSCPMAASSPIAPSFLALRCHHPNVPEILSNLGD